MIEVPEPTEGHPPLDEMVGYVRGTLDRVGHARVERHLAGCRLCANEIGDIVRLRGRKAPLPRGVVFGAVAAAAAALFLVVWTGRAPSWDSPTTTREQPMAGIAAPKPLTPSGSEPGQVVFRWAGAGGLRYRVLLFDSLGSVIFDSTSVGTGLVLPDSVRLVSGDLYLWKVEAEAAPDRWVPSQLSRFRPTGSAAP